MQDLSRAAACDADNEDDMKRVHRQIERRADAASCVDLPRKDSNDLLDELIQLHESKPESTENYLRRMSLTNFGAGHRTMTCALTTILAMVGSHVDVLGRVAERNLRRLVFKRTRGSCLTRRLA